MGGAGQVPDDNVGSPGASARREHERRRSNRERRTRTAHPWVGGVLLALRQAPSNERVWESGADGEQAVADGLTKRCGGRVALLHDRSIPSSRANIDHLAIAPSGVWVIDAKNYKGKVEIRKPLFGEPSLRIAGRDKTSLIQGLARQVAVAEAAIPKDMQADVYGALCFVNADLPFVGKLVFDGFPLLYPRSLAKRLNADGPLGQKDIELLRGLLAAKFPPPERRP